MENKNGSIARRYENKVAIVAGAAKGIGRATAIRLAKEGGIVGLLDHDLNEARSVLDEIVENGGSGRAAFCDVSQEDSVSNSVAEVIGALGFPTLVVNAARAVRFAHFTEIPASEFNRIISVNLYGTFLIIKSVLPHLLGTGGSIVNFAGSSGVIGQAYTASYGAASAGIIQLSKSLARELQDRGVRVNVITSGGADITTLAHYGFPIGAAPRHMERMISPLGLPTPEEAASLVAYLGSDDARCITGTVVSIDGGVTT